MFEMVDNTFLSLAIIFLGSSLGSLLNQRLKGFTSHKRVWEAKK